MGIPVVFARKKIPSTLTQGFYSCQIYSYTKKESVDLVVSNQYIHHNDVVLIVDDFLANGEAAQGMVNIVKQAGASLAGIGIVIEKAFQPGGALIRNAGIRLDSLIKIVSMKSGEITIE
jgi:xanthine phosphoribosyltransferase